MIEHLTLTIAGACVVAYAEWVEPRPNRASGFVADGLWVGGIALFILGTVSALLGALGI